VVREYPLDHSGDLSCSPSQRRAHAFSQRRMETRFVALFAFVSGLSPVVESVKSERKYGHV
jgi:hypothetical protein